MMEEIFEPVRVEAVFEANKIRPLRFVWNNRRYPIEKVSYIWHETKGEELIYYFSVTDGVTMYELSFHTREVKWMLDRIYLEG